MPNAFAYLVLLSWPLVMLVLFIRLPLQKALIWSLLGAYLLLPPEPAGFKVPLISSLNKETLPVIFVSLLALWKYGADAFRLPNSAIGKLLIAMFVAVPLFTVLTNRAPLIFLDGFYVPGLRWNDALGLCIKQILILMPFLLAYNALNSRASLRLLLSTLVIAGLAYSLLMLVEIRLSPQLNNWIYGYHQHQFSQSIRGGGFRPVVFLDHGLWLAFFSMTSTLSALALWRATPAPGRNAYLVAFLYLAGVLILSKSLGALMFGIVLTPLIMFFGRKTQLLIALVIALLVLAYPVLKTSHLFPQEMLVAQASKISPDRAQSLQFRFDNEDTLLARANQKPLFGWGSWGRNHLRDAADGKITSVTDGRWIIVFGVFGWVGFIAEFGLLTLPLIWLRRALKREPDDVQSASVGALALILTFNVLDLLPNATLTPLTWLIAGALLGYGERALREHLPKNNVQDGPSWKPIL